MRLDDVTLTGCADSTFNYCVEGKDGKLYRVFDGTEIHYGWIKYPYIAKLAFSSKDIEKQYYALQISIEEEMLMRYCEFYKTDKCYPFAEIDQTESLSVKNVNCTDKYLRKVGIKAYEFEPQYEYFYNTEKSDPRFTDDQTGTAMYLQV